MKLLRTPLLRRALAGLIVACLVGMMSGPSYAHRVTYTSYGEWLRAQLQGGADDTFDRALAQASGERATSIQQFLHLFVESWDSEGDLDDLAALFGVDGIDGSLLITYLQSRFSGLTPDALPSRTLLSVPPVNSTSGSDRSPGLAAYSDTASRSASGLVVETIESVSHASADARWLLSSMPRLGP